MKDKFIQAMQSGYQAKGATILLGAPMLQGETMTGTFISVPLKTMNRHGLIAGATGTGKTKTLQVLAEQLSAKGVPVLMMDIKGDLSGIAMPSAGHPKIDERHTKIGVPFQAGSSPVEFLSLSDEKGLRLRATVTEFGPVLFSKILDLNDTQAGLIAVVYKYCDDKGIPLLDLKDMKKALQYLSNEGKGEIADDYGTLSTASIGTILRKIVELEQQGAERFFGERSFDVADLKRIDENGKGMISILRLTDLQDRPKLFSTFMLQMLAEVYATFPEQGDSEQPELIIFIDEAHLVFEAASKALLNQIETIVKLIRSKGVGLYFVTQNPTDVPDGVLGQLGMKIQHSLRAFTAKDRKAIKLTAENYPITEFYDTETVLTEMGIGEALVTVLNEKGIPTPLALTLLRAPQSRMDVLTDQEINRIISNSNLIHKYDEEIDRESAYEILGGKIEQAQEQAASTSSSSSRGSARQEKSMIEKVVNNTTTRQIGRTVARELTRGLLGVLGIKSSTRRTPRKTGWF
jgi:uncharacterized protein